jgi:hypothetical protein
VRDANMDSRPSKLTAWLLALPVLIASLAATGCGGTWYAYQAGAASSKVEEAKSLGAEKHAAYEYYLANEHLKKASEEAAQAEYGDAIDLAEFAEAEATKAVNKTRKARSDADKEAAK